MEPNRYLIGIDLGTTNSVVAYADAAAANDGSASIRVLPIPQLTAPGEVREFPALPSFLYFPTADEQAGENLDLPWEKHSAVLSGVMAREHGALVPGRQVSSAKSWLCHPGVDRRAKLLPFEAEPPEPKLSPVEASARYLVHMRDAWNHAHAADQRFENQQIVLTVPASFDAEARELTVEAANQAELSNFTLLEEPLAAFYAWIASHQGSIHNELHDGDLVLVCDVGGGTSDFSLIRVHLGREVEFERTAIGEHLLLGGDNLDAALAHQVEQRLDRKLSLRQRYALRRACTTAKERLLSDPALGHVPVTVLGSGRAVVGRMVSVDLDRDEVLRTLTDGFLPLTGAEEVPHREHRVGLRELGLPYAADPAITRHLSEFLRRAAAADRCPAPNGQPGMARPDAVLFNGGFFVPQIARERVAEAISRWFGTSDWRPKILQNEGMESAVATGAAYYAQVRHGRGLRIKAGSARTYYIGIRSEQQLQGVCVLPAGVNEGTTLALPNREFTVLANRPASFSLYSSTTRCDPHGELIALDPQEIHTHAPLVTVLRYGKMRDVELSVQLTASFTEVGTLELWCESRATQHRWRLQFELRGEQPTAEAPRVPMPSVSQSESIEPAVQLVRDVFGKGESSAQPETLVGSMEAALGRRRESWDITTVRQLADVFSELADGRRKSPRHEVRWLNLYGFCLRPGFAAPGDSGRIKQTRKADNMAFPSDLQCQVERLVFWRRVAGGLNASRQHELYRDCSNLLGLSSKGRGARLNRQLEYEAWRLLASLEQLPGAIRASLGQKLIARIKKEPAAGAWLWSLGRFGARIPVYGPLSCLVSAETAHEWMTVLLALDEFTPDTAFAISQLGLHTDDVRRDIEDSLRQKAVARLNELGFTDYAHMIEKRERPTGAEVARALGESLPKGMRFLSSSDCLLPIAGLVESGTR